MLRLASVCILIVDFVASGFFVQLVVSSFLWSIAVPILKKNRVSSSYLLLRHSADTLFKATSHTQTVVSLSLSLGCLYLPLFAEL